MRRRPRHREYPREPRDFIAIKIKFAALGYDERLEKLRDLGVDPALLQSILPASHGDPRRHSDRTTLRVLDEVMGARIEDLRKELVANSPLSSQEVTQIPDRAVIVWVGILRLCEMPDDAS